MRFGIFFKEIFSVFLESHICWMFIEKWMEAEFKSKTKPIVGFKSKTELLFNFCPLKSESTSAFTPNCTKKAFFKISFAKYCS